MILGLYDELAAYLCGQDPESEVDVGVRLDDRLLGVQRMRLAAPGIAIRITALPPEAHDEYQANLRRLLDHADLRAIQWINITQPLVQFKTLGKRK